MKFEILQEQLVRGLAAVARAVASRPQLPVLSNILLEAKSEGLTLSATDLELGIRVKIAAKVKEKGRVSVPARTFLDFVGSLPPSRVECFLEKEALIIAAGEFRGKVQTIAAEEFPELPSETMKDGVVVGGEELREALGRVMFAAARDALRPALTGVLMEQQKSGLRLVATDGFRLALTKLGVSGSGEVGRALVPARAMGEVARLLGGEKVRISLCPKSSQAMFAGEETMVVTQLLAGAFPEYEKIIPAKFAGSVEVEREELLSALRAVQIFARESSNVVKWEVGSEGIRLSAETPEKGEADARVAGKLEGEGGEIVFNGRFVMDYLAASEAERVRLAFSGPMKPGKLSDAADKDGLYIVMPINV